MLPKVWVSISPFPPSYPVGRAYVASKDELFEWRLEPVSLSQWLAQNHRQPCEEQGRHQCAQNICSLNLEGQAEMQEANGLCRNCAWMNLQMRLARTSLYAHDPRDEDGCTLLLLVQDQLQVPCTRSCDDERESAGDTMAITGIRTCMDSKKADLSSSCHCVFDMAALLASFRFQMK